MLHNNKLTPLKVDDARKKPLAGEAAWQVLAGAREILVAKGKNYQVFDPRIDDKEVILAAASGRTGNLRAPVLRLGDRIFVGFSESLYTRIAEERS
ncbi:MAG: hypothetical protein FWG62_00170 [Proteobacteria bacterium]|nr:hypothetical protein [Pseudomonadota bacterium]